MKYAYPALIRPEEVGEKVVYSVFFPDIRKGGTSGDDVPDALCMAQDFLALALYTMENAKQELPKPSKLCEITAEPGDTVTLVFVDTNEYRKKYDSKAINKTLTLPNWLNTIAEDAGINFSQTLQRALKAELKIAD